MIPNAFFCKIYCKVEEVFGQRKFGQRVSHVSITMSLSDRKHIGGILTFVSVVNAVLLISCTTPIGAQYCTHRGCCPGRDDECSASYHGTLCYCDVFCNQTAIDCCPDFWHHCVCRARPVQVASTTVPGFGKFPF